MSVPETLTPTTTVSDTVSVPDATTTTTISDYYQSYAYDALGNFTNFSGTQLTQYFYDADGQRVKRVTPQDTTLYVSADYQVTGPSQIVTPTYTHKLYLPVMACTNCSGVPAVDPPLVNVASARVTYRFNGQPVAVQEGITLTFVQGDHLGSINLTTNLSGAKVSELR
ncbi:MAG TPA: hypothetical protein VGK81_13060 [Anaerolineae bacterium]